LEYRCYRDGEAANGAHRQCHRNWCNPSLAPILNGAAVIKKFLRQKDQVILRSMNPKYADIIVTESDQCTIAGVALKVVESDL
jgi:hypothetical protein